MPPHSSAPDDGLSARQHIDALMRRVVLMLFAAGLMAMLGIWFLEWRDGSLNHANAIAYPTMVGVCFTCLLALARWPALLSVVRWVGFFIVTVVLLAELAIEARGDAPLVGNYNAVTLLNWLPLCYALAFFLLAERQAAWATALILAFIGGVAAWRGAMPGHEADRSLLLNTLISHGVLVVCLSGMLWLKRVVTRQGEQAQQLRRLAGTDPLTGLANRRVTLRLLDRLAMDRRAGSAAALLLADLDHFKRINDTHGHDVGDRVLVEVAEALREGTRDTDTVARWGGEEFLVVLPHTRPAEAVELAARLRARIERLEILDGRGQRVPITMSVGIAALGPWDGIAAWLRRADEALYRAKAGGRNRCELAEPVDLHEAAGPMASDVDPASGADAREAPAAN